ncbi:MAG: hypothetical protein FJX76_27845, partial [Armatimonadetes bacterium]|nr:hypothetical protein [Armatimonadota bacterium]
MRTPAVWPAFSYFWLFSIAFPLALADRLQLGAVVGLGLVAAALGVYFSGRSMSAQEPLTGWPVAAAGLVGILLTTATWLRPMTFVDTYFRWDFLARLLLERGSISFYPPLEFDVYYYPDGIPPLISFSYWLLYAAAGAWTPSLTALMIGVQYAACLGLTFALARTLGGSGALAVGVLVSSAEFLRSIAMGQETGVTCMSVLAICVILICEEATWKSALAAGIAAGVGALAREYGLAFVLAGIIVMGWRRRPARDFLVYVAAWAVVALPWYARTWMMTGNPLYDNPSGTFPGNPVHVALLNTYAFIWSHQPERWWEVFRLLCVTAWAPLFLGLIGALATMRRNLDVVLCIALVVGLFVLSCGYTAAGPVWAARVLAPALALLAALAGACA